MSASLESESSAASEEPAQFIRTVELIDTTKEVCEFKMEEVQTVALAPNANVVQYVQHGYHINSSNRQARIGKAKCYSIICLFAGLIFLWGLFAYIRLTYGAITVTFVLIAFACALPIVWIIVYGILECLETI